MRGKYAARRARRYAREAAAQQQPVPKGTSPTPAPASKPAAAAPKLVPTPISPPTKAIPKPVLPSPGFLGRLKNVGSQLKTEVGGAAHVVKNFPKNLRLGLRRGAHQLRETIAGKPGEGRPDIFRLRGPQVDRPVLVERMPPKKSLPTYPIAKPFKPPPATKVQQTTVAEPKKPAIQSPPKTPETSTYKVLPPVGESKYVEAEAARKAGLLKTPGLKKKSGYKEAPEDWVRRIDDLVNSLRKPSGFPGEPGPQAAKADQAKAIRLQQELAQYKQDLFRNPQRARATEAKWQQLGLPPSKRALPSTGTLQRKYLPTMENQKPLPTPGKPTEVAPVPGQRLPNKAGGFKQSSLERAEKKLKPPTGGSADIGDIYQDPVTKEWRLGATDPKTGEKSSIPLPENKPIGDFGVPANLIPPGAMKAAIEAAAKSIPVKVEYTQRCRHQLSRDGATQYAKEVCERIVKVNNQEFLDAPEMVAARNAFLARQAAEKEQEEQRREQLGGRYPVAGTAEGRTWLRTHGLTKKKLGEAAARRQQEDEASELAGRLAGRESQPRAGTASPAPAEAEPTSTDVIRSVAKYSFKDVDLGRVKRSYAGLVMYHKDNAVAAVMDRAAKDVAAMSRAKTDDEREYYATRLAEHHWAMSRLAQDYPPERIVEMARRDLTQLSEQDRRATAYAVELLPARQLRDLASALGLEKPSEELSHEVVTAAIQARILGHAQELPPIQPQVVVENLTSTLPNEVRRNVGQRILDFLSRESKKFGQYSRPAQFAILGLMGAAGVSASLATKPAVQQVEQQRAVSEYREEKPRWEQQLAPGQSIREVSAEPAGMQSGLPVQARTYRTVGLPSEEVEFAKKMIERDAREHGIVPLRVEDVEEATPEGHHKFRVYFHLQADIDRKNQEEARRKREVEERAKQQPAPKVPAWFNRSAAFR